MRRPRFDGHREALHVTVRFARHVWNLRSQRGFACVERALRHEQSLGELRIVHFSVQGNHLHLIAEAQDHRVLARRMQGFGIRLARALNGLMKRSGRVYGDRYHVRPLKSARETSNAVRYVLQNHAKHAAQAGRKPPPEDRFASSSWSAALAQRPSRGPPPPRGPALVTEPMTSVLRSGFRFASRAARGAGATR